MDVETETDSVNSQSSENNIPTCTHPRCHALMVKCKVLDILVFGGHVELYCDSPLCRHPHEPMPRDGYAYHCFDKRHQAGFDLCLECAYLVCKKQHKTKHHFGVQPENNYSSNDNEYDSQDFNQAPREQEIEHELELELEHDKPKHKKKQKPKRHKSHTNSKKKTPTPTPIAKTNKNSDKSETESLSVSPVTTNSNSNSNSNSKHSNKMQNPENLQLNNKDPSAVDISVIQPQPNLEIGCILGLPPLEKDHQTSLIQKNYYKHPMTMMPVPNGNTNKMNPQESIFSLKEKVERILFEANLPNIDPSLYPWQNDKCICDLRDWQLLIQWCDGHQLEDAIEHYRRIVLDTQALYDQKQRSLHKQYLLDSILNPTVTAKRPLGFAADDAPAKKRRKLDLDLEAKNRNSENSGPGFTNREAPLSGSLNMKDALSHLLAIAGKSNAAEQESVDSTGRDDTNSKSNGRQMDEFEQSLNVLRDVVQDDAIAMQQNLGRDLFSEFDMDADLKMVHLSMEYRYQKIIANMINTYKLINSKLNEKLELNFRNPHTTIEQEVKKIAFKSDFQKCCMTEIGKLTNMKRDIKNILYDETEKRQTNTNANANAKSISSSSEETIHEDMNRNQNRNRNQTQFDWQCGQPALYSNVNVNVTEDENDQIDVGDNSARKRNAAKNKIKKREKYSDAELQDDSDTLPVPNPSSGSRKKSATKFECSEKDKKIYNKKFLAWLSKPKFSARKIKKAPLQIRLGNIGKQNQKNLNQNSNSNAISVQYAKLNQSSIKINSSNPTNLQGNLATAWASETFWVQHYKKHRGHFEWFAQYSDFKWLLETVLCHNKSIGHKNNINNSATFVLSDYLANNPNVVNGRLSAQEKEFRRAKISQMNVFDFGCGSSQLAAKLILESHFAHVTCLDRCRDAIQNAEDGWVEVYTKQSEEYRTLSSKIDFIVADILTAKLQRRSYDVVVDKGTLDALDCGPSALNSEHVNFSDNFSKLIDVALVLHRILVPNGYLVILTSRSISKRMEFVHALHNKHQRYFRKAFSTEIKSNLVDYKDGKAGSCKLLILQAIKDKK